MKTKTKNHKGFTLLEILLVVAAITILAGVVIVALNPSKQIGSVQDAARRSDVNTIISAVYQYIIDGNQMPASITTNSTDICQTGVEESSCVDLAVLTTDALYLVEMPQDPANTSETGTGYEIFRTANGRITVTAPLSESTISVTR